METQSIIYSLFLIFVGCAITATLALWARQALIISYIILGMSLGPWGLAWVDDTALLADIAEIGIMFLLFMLGLNLAPQKLLLLLKQTTIVTIITSASFSLFGGIVALAFDFSWMDVLIIGFATMFSSTIIGLKLLPTTVLHHRHTGEVIISVLLLQDLIAIAVMLWLGSQADASSTFGDVAMIIISLPAVISLAWLGEKYILLQLIRKFDRVQEYIFLLAIAWCLGVAQLAHSAGLSYEIGAFIAGITLATSPIALFIAESLKPVRDFFLVLFFFAIGANINLVTAIANWAPALILAVGLLVIKPVVFRFALDQVSESPKLAWETGWRLGQMSEFSLLIVFLALEYQLLSIDAANVVQLATVLTFIGSSSWIVMRFSTPVAITDRLRRD
ncbi:MAG TPA: sodium:proton antiporter [Gammaproteobacteria bacterium]|jgi:Kef-type K+ transport system membrane component KefB|nr:sodium:proton antiporter [Gammaproteobacteria bacterium]